MAETVKKSRIVSDEEENLEAALLEEFNTRLKHCMSKDDLQEDPDDSIFDNSETIANKFKVFSKNGLASNDFIQNEREQYYDVPVSLKPFTNGASIQNKQNGHEIEEENIYETLPEPEKTEKVDQKLTDLSPKTLILDLSPKDEKPTFNLKTTDFSSVELSSQDDLSKSVKDRMFLTTDDAAATLLFTQTVTSPMLTPSEENIDFLKGFQGDNTNSDESNSLDSPHKEQNEAINEESNKIIYENVNQNIYENLKEPIQENIYENLKEIEVKIQGEVDKFKDHIYQEIDELSTNGHEVIVENTLYHNFDNGDLITDLDAVDNCVQSITTLEHNYEEICDLINESKEVIEESKESYSELINHSKTESNYYEKYTEIVSKNTSSVNNGKEKDTETVPAEIVKNLKSQFSKASPDVINVTKKELDDVEPCKKVNIMEQIIKFEHKDCGDGLSDDSSVTETYTETTTIQSDNPEEKTLKKKKTKKSRREEKENISVKSSFSKFDALQKKNVLHIRSSDSAKAQEKFNGAQVDMTNCKACSKQVFQMEQIKAEKAVWHKNCFRCTECSKQLTVETYVSHEGNLYCKPHFKSLFAPKVVEDDTPSSDKPDLGLEELQSLNMKERFQVFEHYQTESQDLDRGPINVKKSSSILSKLAKFQSKGMDIGVTDDALNGIPVEESSSEEEEEEEEVPDGEDPTLFKAKKVQKEKPFHFTNLNEVKNKWEHGEQNSKDERREERKQEIQSIRNKLFLGKQGKMKEAYQQAVMQSESCTNMLKTEKIESCDTKSLKEKFEKGELQNDREHRNGEEDDTEVFQSEISKKSRSLFLELDANAAKQPQSISPVSGTKLDVKKARESDTPDREIYHDPEVIRSDENVDDSEVAKASHTASKMLSKFRQMEENLSRDPEPVGPKPLKRFTPPPEPTRPESESGEETGSEEEEEEDDEQIDNQKLPEDIIEAQKAARAKQLRAKFEKWEAQEIKREQNQAVNIIEEYGDESQVESTKSLRARFESMRETSSDKTRTPRAKVNRFV